VKISHRYFLELLGAQLPKILASAQWRADIERAIAQKLESQPQIVEIRIFESQPSFRREIWVAEKDGKRLTFDITLTAAGQGVQFTVRGPVEIEGYLK